MRRAGTWAFAGLTVVVLGLVACGGQTPPTGNGAGLSIGHPVDGQVVAGTFGTIAAGYGGQAVNVTYEIGGLTADADADGIAYVDSRALPDGEHVLRATAVVGGVAVSDEVAVVVRNELPSSGVVGADGGALKSEGGSIASIPPGAFASVANVSVDDVTEEEILAEFGIDYSAMGVTFLGAMEIDTNGAPAGLPAAVDLAGWSQAVQPGQQVVMFLLAPDADGDGQGELTFGAGAAAAGGSVVTTPVQRAEVYAAGGAAGIGAQQVGSRRPGELVVLSGRGFNPLSPLSNVARYGPQGAPTAETLLYAWAAGGSSVNPLQEIVVAVPALASGASSLRLHNLTTGYASAAVSLSVSAPGSAPPSVWSAFVQQVQAGAAALATAEPHLAARLAPWVERLSDASYPVLAAMASNSGLVSAANLDSMAGLDPEALTPADRDLIAKHALVLDAMAVSAGLDAATADAAADLATLLMQAAHRASVPMSGGSIAPLQSEGPSCNGASPSSDAVPLGEPVTTGMGAAVPGSCGAGNAAGDAAAGGESLGDAAARGLLPAEQLAVTSLRRGTFRPVRRAIVKVYRPDGVTTLSPFTALTDGSGYFYLPFLPPGEPYLVRAYDPVTLQVAESSGVSRGQLQVTPIQLVFEPRSQGPGAPTADFTITPLPHPDFDGTVYYRFDASASTDDVAVKEYVWDFGGLRGSVLWTPDIVRGYGNNGSYEIRLTVFDEDGNFDSVVKQLTIDDLPYDYWAEPPRRVTETADGSKLNAEAEYHIVISADNRYVLFATAASNLSPQDTNGIADIYLKDLETGAVELLSADASGKATGGYYGLMSLDTSVVAYQATQNSIVVLDRATGESRTIVNPGGFQRTTLAALSGDGGTIAFDARTLNDPVRASYVMDLATDQVKRVGRNLADDGWENVAALELNGDGRYLLLQTSAPLVDEDDNAKTDLYRLDLLTDVVELVSVAADGTIGDGGNDAFTGSMSADGRFVTFWSDVANWPGASDNDSSQFSRSDDIWVKDMTTGELRLASTNAKGAAADDDSVLSVISADGRYVAFGSYAQNLTPVDQLADECHLQCTLGTSFVKDLVTGRVALVTVGMGAALPNEWDQIEPVISPDGRYVGFYSWASNLVVDDDVDTYDYFVAENPLWEP